jgi:hypothetical protein
VTKIKVKNKATRVSQGSIFKEIECIESITEVSGVIEVSKIVYPLVVVMTQDCDLEQDVRNNPKAASGDDKKLLSILVVPLYNAEMVFLGQHLSDLGLGMATIKKSSTRGNNLMNNETPRYHYLDFPDNVGLVAQIADFKHYFSVNLAALSERCEISFVCQVSELYREHLSHRFASYLARIGLPDDGPLAV